MGVGIWEWDTTDPELLPLVSLRVGREVGKRF